jgi:hypothetical protein
MPFVNEAGTLEVLSHFVTIHTVKAKALSRKKFFDNVQLASEVHSPGLWHEDGSGARLTAVGSRRMIRAPRVR